MDWLPLPIFPEGALASSVVTTVWVGVFFVAFFNLRFGWPLSGLVVPGYLTPLLLVKPLSAVVVLAEGVLTYALVWFYSEFLARRCGWSSFFGRDRFFALVLTSVAVRLAMDGWLLPEFGEWFNQTFALAFDYRNHLHSFGLIIVSLIANNFWKSGLRRGLVPMATLIVLTYLTVRFGLIEFTNFNINSLGYAYEDIAVSVLASPKAYIILLTTAFIASRMNLLYGWDFAGILIPSLLALQWFQPSKIVTSLLEAIIVLLLASAASRLPIFRGVTMEGARKLLLFFNVSFLYKYVLAYLVLWWFPEQRISDLYGFGYLLPTLIAIKMHDKGIVVRMIRMTLQTSLVAAGLATLVGFAISLIPDPIAAPQTELTTTPALPVDTLAEALRAEKVGFHRTRIAEAMTPPLGGDLEHFRRGVTALLAYRENRTAESLLAARAHLARAHYEVVVLEERYLVLRELKPRRHWGLYALALTPSSPLTVEAPAPLDEPGSAEVALWFFRLAGGQALAIAGSTRHANQEGSSDVLATPRTIFEVFHRTVARRDVLQVRAYTEETTRATFGLRPSPATPAGLVEAETTLWVKRELPTGLDLARLETLAPGFRLNWQEAPGINLQQDGVQRGFASFVLNRRDARNFLARVLHAETTVRLTVEQRRIEGYLQDWLLADRSRIALAGSEAYRPPAIEDVLHFDAEVVTPLLELGRDEYRSGQWSDAGLDGLRVIQDAAAIHGYEVVRYHHQRTGSDYLILAEREGKPRRHWGTYLLRLGRSRPFLVQVPRPGFEVNSFEFGVALFETLQAQALAIAGAYPNANADASSDVLRLPDKENAFNVFSQALLRHWGEAPGAIVQSRATAVRRDAPTPVEDVLLTSANGATTSEQLAPIGQELWRKLGRFDVTTAFAKGEPAAAGYEAGGVPQALYLPATVDKDFLIAWVSPVVRAGYRQQTEPTPQESLVNALGIPSRDGDLRREVAQSVWSDEALAAADRELLRRFLASQDILLLDEFKRPRSGMGLERLTDLDSRQGFLLVRDRWQRLLAVVNLNARPLADDLMVDFRSPDVSLTRFIDRRAGLLLARENPR